MADTPDDRETEQTIEDLDELLKRIPHAALVAKELRDLKALLVARRLPRIAVVGRRGAGKSSLANALMGAEVLAVGAVEDTTQEAGWVQLKLAGRALRWMDTPGLRAGSEPQRRKSVQEALRLEAPDVLLVLCKAGQVDAGIDEDLEEVKAMVEVVEKFHKVKLPIVAVLTRVDELAPLSIKTPPYDRDETKKANIAQAVAALKGHFERAKVEVKAVVPVAAYMRFKDAKLATDWRWNLDALSAAIFAELPRGAQIEAARAFERARRLRRKLAMKIVGTSTGVSFVVGATPLPVADLALLLPLQSTMLTWLVYVSGRSFNPRAVTEWLSGIGVNITVGIGMREMVRALLKLVPGFGATLSGATAATGTWALGLAAIKYFIDGGTHAESRRVFDDAGEKGAPDAGAVIDEDMSLGGTPEGGDVGGSGDGGSSE